MESRAKKDAIPAASAAPAQACSIGAGSQDPSSMPAPSQDAMDTLAYDADAEAASYGTPYFSEKNPDLLLTVESAWKVDHLLRKGAADMGDAALAERLQLHHAASSEVPFPEEKLHLASTMDENSKPADAVQHPVGDVDMGEPQPMNEPAQAVATEPASAEPNQVAQPVDEPAQAVATEPASAEPNQVAQPMQVVVEDEIETEKAEAIEAQHTPLEHGAATDLVEKQDVVSMLECMLEDGMDLKDAIEQVKGAPLVLRVEQFKNKNTQKTDDDSEGNQLAGQSKKPKAKAKAKAKASAKRRAKAKASHKAAAKRKPGASKATGEESDDVDEVLDSEDEKPMDEKEKTAETEESLPEPESTEMPETELDEPPKAVKRKVRKAHDGKEPQEVETKQDPKPSGESKEEDAQEGEPKPKKQRPEANSFARRPCPATSPAKDRWAAIAKTFKDEIRKPLMDLKEPISKCEEGWGCESGLLIFHLFVVEIV